MDWIITLMNVRMNFPFYQYFAEELSKREIKKNQTDIAKYKTGVFVPRKKTLKAICDVLRFNQNYILYGMEPYLTVKKNPVGREYLLKTVNYNDETIRTSLIELDEPTREIRSPKYMLGVLSQDYLDHFKEICADDSWDKEDLAAVYSFIEFIRYRNSLFFAQFIKSRSSESVLKRHYS